MFETIEIADAIKKLHPEAEFVIRDQDYTNIEWIVLEGEAPTKKQIEDMAAAIRKEKDDKKSAAEAKLAALGLSVDDLKALGLA